MPAQDSNEVPRESHPAIYMQRPFRWMYVRLTDVNDPLHVLWRGMYKFDRLTDYLPPH